MNLNHTEGKGSAQGHIPGTWRWGSNPDSFDPQAVLLTTGHISVCRTLENLFSICYTNINFL